MAQQAVFDGLIVDEQDHPVEVTMIGGEAFYIVDDAGFKRHIPSEQVDRQILDSMRQMITGHEDMLGEQTAKMLGQEDIFSRALIENQLKQIDQQFDALLKSGIPSEGRAYMGMMGFKVHINLHGEVLDIEQPGAIDPDESE
jgi:hypothetical protein